MAFAAALAFPALLALYLLRLQRRPLRISSILFWRASASDLQVNTPIAPPRPSWLLLLHAAALLLVVGAIGRPTILQSGGSSSRLIVVIDRSASMSAKDAGEVTARRTRLAEALQQARELVARAGDAGSRVGVVSLAGTARIEASLGPPRAALEALAAITPTDQPANLAAALEVVGSMLRASGVDDDAPPEVVLFSDGDFEEVPASAGLDAALRLVRVGPAPGTSAENLGVVSVAARVDETDPTTLSIFARIQNASLAERSVSVRLSFNGRTVDVRTLRVPPMRGVTGAAPGEASAPMPGEISTVFRLPRGEGGVAAISLGVDPATDLLESDDTAAMLLRPGVLPRVLLVSPNAAARSNADEPDLAGSLLRTVLEELRPASFDAVRADRYEALASEGGLTRYDVIVFDRVQPARSPPIASLSFGAGLDEPGLRLAGAGGDAPEPVLLWDREHPTLRSVTLDGVVASRERRQSAPDESVRAIARGAAAPLVLERATPGLPRRLVVTFALADSNWPLQAGFPIFVKSAIDLLAGFGPGEVTRQFTTAEPARLEVGAAGGPDLASIRFSGPSEIDARVVDGVATLGVVERAGVYVAEFSNAGTSAGTQPPGAGGERSLGVVCVNLLSPRESLVQTSAVVRVGQRMLTETGGEPARREIWAWLLMAAATLLLIEWVVFARSARV